MIFQPGDVYRTKSGEILEVAEFPDGEFCFRLRHPVTLEYTEHALYGPIGQLDDAVEGLGMELIDLKTHKPTGLVTLHE